MRRLSERTLWYFTGITLAGLLFITLAGSRATSNYADSMNWLSHTQQVETEIEQIRSNLFAAQNGRFEYVFAGRSEGLEQYHAATEALPVQLSQLRRLTLDNPAQKSLLDSVAPLIEQQFIVLRTSTEMKLQGGSTELQDQISQNVSDLSRATTAKLDSMRLEEARLLGVRKIISDKTYRTQAIILSISFAIILLFTVLNFVQLLSQLHERRTAELAVRRLSGRILQVQDEERRKLARDLHDGIGQLFTALKMALGQAMPSDNGTHNDSEALAECLQLVDEGLTQTRTLSYLLHPPMLDEVGFPAAARWLVHGFSDRSKIPVSLEISDNLKLPRELELTLFRVLQEGLTNIHRHSGSDRAEVAVNASSREVIMTLKDYGRGIPEQTLENFRSSKAPAGVGLAGMRGRVADMNGTLDLESAGHGTVVRVTIPLSNSAQISPASPGSPTFDGIEETSAPQQSSLRQPGLKHCAEEKLS